MGSSADRRAGTRLLRALPTLLRVGVAEAVAYRAELLIWILTATLPLIMLALWDAVALGGPVAGFGRDEFARYFTVTLIARQLTASWVVWELNEDIRTGSLSPQLLRPVNPLWMHLFRNFAALPLRMVVLVPILAALLAWRPGMGLDPAPWRVAVFVLSCGMAWLIAFLFQAMFGSLAFWFEQSIGVFNVWFGLWAIFGGYVVPLALLPPALQSISAWTPFPAMLAIPVEIGAGLVAPDRIAWRLLEQLGWLAVALLAFAAVWRAGVRRYGAFGA